MLSFRRDHNRGLWESHPIWPDKTDWALLSSRTIPYNSHTLIPRHWSCFHLTHPLTKSHFHPLKNFQCLRQETLILRDIAKSKVLGENKVGQEWWRRSRNQHCTTQILGTWSVTSRKMVAVMHRQDAKSFLLWIRTMLPCPGWTDRGRAWLPGVLSSAHSLRPSHVEEPSGCQFPPLPFLLGPGLHDGLRSEVPSGPGLALRGNSMQSS